MPSTEKLPASITPCLPNHNALLLGGNAVPYGTSTGLGEFDSDTLARLIDLRGYKSTGLGRNPLLEWQ